MPIPIGPTVRRARRGPRPTLTARLARLAAVLAALEAAFAEAQVLRRAAHRRYRFPDE